MRQKPLKEDIYDYEVTFWYKNPMTAFWSQLSDKFQYPGKGSHHLASAACVKKWGCDVRIVRVVWCG